MGVAVRIALYAENQQKAENAALAAYARIAALESVMSDYRPDSELSRLTASAATGPQTLSPDLFAILDTSLRIAQATGGAFDPTIGPLTTLWRASRRSGTLPDLATLTRARQSTGYTLLTLNRKLRTAALARRGMRLDLGGIGKGWACAEALDVLTAQGITSALIESGGDIAVSGPPPGTEGWAIAFDESTLTLTHSGISTSGDTEQFVLIGGRRYSHIVNPRTGLGDTQQAAASVVIPNDKGGARLSDPLATAVTLDSNLRAVAHQFGATHVFRTP